MGLALTLCWLTARLKIISLRLVILCNSIKKQLWLDNVSHTSVHFSDEFWRKPKWEYKGKTMGRTTQWNTPIDKKNHSNTWTNSLMNSEKIYIIFKSFTFYLISWALDWLTSYYYVVVLISFKEDRFLNHFSLQKCSNP